MRGFRLDLLSAVGASLGDFDLARFHLFWNLALEIDVQETVLEARTGDFNEVGKLETALESTSGDTTIENFTDIGSIFIRLLTLDRQQVAMRFDFEFTFGKARDRHGDAIGVLTRALDIIRRIGLVTFRRSERIKHGEEPIETDRGTIERGKIYVTHVLEHNPTGVKRGSIRLCLKQKKLERRSDPIRSKRALALL